MCAGKAALHRVAQGRRYKPFPRFEKVNFIVWLRASGGGEFEGPGVSPTTDSVRGLEDANFPRADP